MMQDPNFTLSFAADKVQVARSGDLAYETGSYTLTMSDPEGKPTTQKGHYVDIWKKDPSGGWKVAVDAPVSDPPEE
jgi:ketosteroid isomerase-like protein